MNLSSHNKPRSRAILALLGLVWVGCLAPDCHAQAPPVIKSIAIVAGNVQITFGTEFGASYDVQRSSDLISWSILLSTSGTGSDIIASDPSVGPKAFYRIVRDGGIYSVNIAGYASFSLTANWNSIANPFSGVTQIQSVLPSLPGGAEVRTVGASGLDCAIFDDFDGWLDCSTFNPSTMTLGLAKGSLINPGSATTVTYVGIIVEGILRNKLPAGISLCSSMVPQAGGVTSALGFPAQDGDVIYRFNGASFSIYEYYFGAWDPEEPVMAVGEAFWVNLASARDWVRFFTVSGGGGTNTVITQAYLGGFDPLVPGSSGPAPPSITLQPQSQTNLLGSDAVFSVSASGSGLRYQWRFANQNIPGATNSSYFLSNVQSANAGSYSVVVSNDVGSTPSANATLAVRAVIVDGRTVFGSAVATNSALIQIVTAYTNGSVFYTLNGQYPGTGPLYYGPFALSTSAVVRVLSYNGTYTRAAEAAPINVTVLKTPDILTQPQNQDRIVGGVASFAVTAAGSGTLSYQWYRTNTPIVSATFSTLTISNVQPSDAGSYMVIVANAYGQAVSAPAVLGVFAPVAINTQPDSTNVLANSPVTFSVLASGTPPLQYQWRLNGANLSGETNSTLTIAHAQLSDGGIYTVVVLNEIGSVISDPAQLIVQVPSLQPGDDFEDRVLLPVVGGSVSGSNTLATKQVGEPDHAGKAGGKSVWYKWKPSADGVAVINTRGSTFDSVLAVYVGSTLNSLTIVADDDDSGGKLTSQVRFNAIGGTDYAIAIDGVGASSGYLALSWSLDAASPDVPVIISPPQDVAVQSGNNAIFAVTAIGTGLLYQWLFNGVPITDANGSALTVTNAQVSDVGSYSVVVSNASAQSVVSAAANLELSSQPAPPTRDKFADLTGSGSGLLPSQGASAIAAAGFTPVSFGIPGSQDFVNTRSWSDLTDPAVCAVGGYSRWLIFGPSSGGLLSLDTVGTSPTLPTIIAVFRGSSLTDLVPAKQVGCDVNSAPDGHSLVRFSVEAGSLYSVLIDGTNGTSGLIHFNYCLGSPPVVAESNAAPIAVQGEPLVLHGPVSGGTPGSSYQWYLNGAPISGATQSDYNTGTLPVDGAGFYSLVASNCLGISSNVVARVTVAIPLHINYSALHPGGVLDFHVLGTASRAFIVQGSSNFLNWIPLFTNTIPFAPLIFADPVSGVHPWRFYRAMPWDQ